MSYSSVLADTSGLSRADRFVYRLESALTATSGVVIFALVFVAAANVLGRKLFNAPMPGFIDWIEQFMAIFAFFGLAYCQRDGGHIRMDILIGRARRRTLWAAEGISVVLMLIVTTALIYGSWFHFLRSFDLSSPLWSRDSSIDISLPIWPAKLLVALSMGLLWLRLSLQLWGYWRAFRLNQESPVAVPLVLDIADQAAREAHAVEGGHGQPD